MKLQKMVLIIGMLILVAGLVPYKAMAYTSVLRDSEVYEQDVTVEGCGMTLTGTAEVRFFMQFVYDSNEGQHRQVRVISKYELLSEDGTSYSGHSKIQTLVNGRFPEPSSAINLSSSGNTLLVAKGEGRKMILNSTRHWTINANGDLTTEFSKYNLSCK
jgi:hypothetical protein